MGESLMRGLAVESPATISNTGGPPTYLLLGMDTSSISSKANASDVKNEKSSRYRI